MVKIQLTDPQEGYLDVKEGTVFPLNFGVADIRDISKRVGKFTKTVTLSGTANNNKLLNNYFNVNVVAGTFDVNALQKCIILQNDFPILRNAYIQLLSVTRVAETELFTGEQLVEYEVLIRDATANLFTEIADAKLEDIPFTDLDHTYSAANVVGSFGNDYTDGYKYILPYTPNNFYALEQCKPAVYAIQYWDRIFARGGFRYNWTGNTLAHMRKLLIPYNGDALQMSADDLDYLTAIAEESSQIDNFNQTSNGINVSADTTIVAGTEVQDDSSSYNPLTGQYTSSIYTGNAGGYDVTFTFDYEIILNNTTGATAYLRGVGTSAAAYNRYRGYIGIECNGLTQQSQFPSYVQYDVGDSIPSGDTTIQSGSLSRTISINAPYSPNVGDTLEPIIGIDVNSFFGRWRASNSDSGSTVRVDTKIELTNIRIEIKPRVTNVVFGSIMQVNDVVPRDVKQSDFIKSICNMFNLYMEADEFDENLINITSRDEYYDAGDVKDWNKKLARNQTNTIQFLPELGGKKMLFTYKEDKDAANVGYVDNVKEIYGQLEFTFDSEHVKGTTKNEIIFSPTPCALSGYGGVNPIYDGIAPKTNIRVLYDGGEQNCSSFDIYNYGTTGELGITQYPAITTFDNPLAPTYDINYGVCDYYFYQVPQLTNNNLFNNYYRRQTGQMNSGIMLTGMFRLDQYDIVSLRLNDKVFLDSKYWHINKVIDYNPMVEGLTKVELISADTEIQLPRFPVRPYTKPSLGEAQVGQPINSDWQTTTGSTNNIEGASQVINSEYNSIKGNGSVIFGGRKNAVSGDNIMITNSSDNVVSGERIALINSDNNVLKNCVNVTVTNTSGVEYENLNDCLIDRGMIVSGADSVSLITSNKDIVASELAIFNGINAAGGNITIKLPNPYDIQSMPIFFKRADSSGNTVTIDANTIGGSTIDGDNTITLDSEQGVILFSNRNSWAILADYNPSGGGGGGGLTFAEVLRITSIGI